MGTLIITQGIPGSGKTTWAQAWVAENPTSRARVNRDDIRFNVFGTRKTGGAGESDVTRVQHAILKALLRAGRDVVCDDTNLVPAFVERLVNIADDHGYTVRFRKFFTPVEEAIQRDALREHPVGADVIRRYAARVGQVA